MNLASTGLKSVTILLINTHVVPSSLKHHEDCWPELEKFLYWYFHPPADLDHSDPSNTPLHPLSQQHNACSPQKDWSLAYWGEPLRLSLDTGHALLCHAPACVHHLYPCHQFIFELFIYSAYYYSNVEMQHTAQQPSSNCKVAQNTK